MLMSQKDLCFLLVDVQEKLFPLVHEYRKLAENCQWLLRLAHELDIPVVISEQYPQGLGHTIPELQEFLPPQAALEKVHFSCAADQECLAHITQLNKHQIVVFGIEAHVCILQTVLGLIHQGFHVFVVADAISSRTVLDRDMGIQRMRSHGAHIVTKEMIFFECLQRAGTEQFKQLSKRFFQQEKK